MKGIFFLLPFILVASIGIFQDTFANNVIVGYDYFITDNLDGTKTWQSHEPYVFDGVNYVPFIQSGNSIQTFGGSVTLNNDGSFSWGTKFTDKIVGKYADISNLNTWTYPNTLNNDVPDVSWNGTAFVASKVKSGVGQLDYIYALNNGDWKTQLEVINLSSLNTKVFGFDQIVDLESDTIRFGGVVRNLDNFNGTVFDKTFLINNEGKILDLLNGVNFDFDLGFENLYSITVYDTGVNKSRLVFDYRTNTILLPNEKLIIDPTFGYTSGTWKRYYSDLTSGGTANCKTDIAVGGADTNNQGILRSDNTGGRCQLYTVKNDISSLPIGITVSSTTVRYDVSAISSPNGCDIFAVTNDPDVASNAAIWTDSYDGNQYASDITGCDSTGNNKTIVLSSNANTDIETLRASSSSYFTFSMVQGNWDAISGTSETTLDLASGSVDLEIVYTETQKPTTPTNLLATATSSTQINLGWDAAPSYDNVSGYKIFRESPTGGGWAVLVNDTGTSTNSYSNTGLTTKTQYNYMIAAYNATGISNNSTASSAYTWGVPDAVTSFTVTGLSTTSLYLDWTAPVTYGYAVTGYKIERESPTGGGFSTIVADTGNTNTDYTDTGLALLTEYNYRVTPISSFGNGASATASGTTPSAPPTSFTMNDAAHTLTTQLNQEWIAPSGTILGYKLLCETPIGNGFTTLINDTGSTNQYYNATGLISGSVYNCKVAAWTAGGLSAYSSTYAYSPHHLPDAVIDLSASSTTLSSIILSWSAPTPYSTSISCYAINYTVPVGNPQTVITSCTPTTGTSYEISGLSLGTEHSFRVSAVTVHGQNATGNIVNATAFSEFTIGDISIPTDDNYHVDVLFAESDYNSTAKQVNVIYPNDVTDFRCDVLFQFAMTNQTYANMTATAYDADYDYSTFIFNNADNEIIDLDCYDNDDLDVNGNYIITQSTFPFVDQINDFRNGVTFGSGSGDFGGLDLITLIVIIVSMVGFSKANPAAGVIVSVMILGATAYFGIINLPATVISSLVLAVVIAVVITRK